MDDLNPRDRRSILGRVAGELEAALTGKESERAVEARVDEILDEELGEAEDGDDEDDEEDSYDEDGDRYDEDDEHEDDEDEE